MNVNLIIFLSFQKYNFVMRDKFWLVIKVYRTGTKRLSWANSRHSKVKSRDVYRNFEK